MGVEDISDSDPSVAQSRSSNEEKQSVQGSIAIKGTRNGLLLTLEPETPFSEMLNALSERLAGAPDFFRGASLAVDTSRRALRTSEQTQLESLLAHYQMSVMSLEQFAAARKDLGAGPPPSPPTPPTLTDTLITNLTSEMAQTQNQRDWRESDDTLFLRRTVRSGQAIQHHSNVVVLGDVNAGAEIVAGGDIIVWGVLRGLVHAGYPNNENAQVCSLLLAPVQLRIAHLLSRPPEGVEVQPRPEVASIKQEQIVVETWVNGRPPKR
jgi:septum site-determining protein MinC